MNPGPPGCKPGAKYGSAAKTGRKVIHQAGSCVEITEDLVQEFFDWLRRVNPRIGKSLRDYSYYIPKLAGVRLCGKEDVQAAFDAMGGVNKSSYTAFSRFLTFLEKTRELDELVARLRRAMPRKPRTGEDTWVPPDSLLLEARARIERLGPPYTLVYNVMVSTGCRATEALHLIRSIRGLRAVDLGGYVRVHVDLQRGSKNEFVMYLPRPVYDQLLSYTGPLPTIDTVKKRFIAAGIPVKYYRKWWRQKLKRLGKKLGIDSEDIEAFQGRVSSIGGRHYTDWLPILDEDYAKVLPHLKKFLITPAG